jgi:hypothetical protein
LRDGRHPFIDVTLDVTDTFYADLLVMIQDAVNKFAELGRQCMNDYDTTSAESVNAQRTVFLSKRLNISASYVLRSYISAFVWNDGYCHTIYTIMNTMGYRIDTRIEDRLTAYDDRLRTARTDKATESKLKRKAIHKRTRQRTTEQQETKGKKAGIAHSAGSGLPDTSTANTLKLLSPSAMLARDKIAAIADSLRDYAPQAPTIAAKRKRAATLRANSEQLVCGDANSTFANANVSKSKRAKQKKPKTIPTNANPKTADVASAILDSTDVQQKQHRVVEPIPSLLSIETLSILTAQFAANRTAAPTTNHSASSSSRTIASSSACTNASTSSHSSSSSAGAADSQRLRIASLALASLPLLPPPPPR